MLRRISPKFLSVALSALLGTLNPAAAQTISLTAKAEAGIDPATRRFIETLPIMWQKPIQDILDNALTRIDKSVALALVEVEDTFSNVMNEAQCVAVGTESNMVDDIVKRFPWVKEQQPMEDLSKEISSVEKERKYSSSPTEIKYKYDHIAILTSVVKCKYPRIAIVVHDLNLIEHKFNRKWLVWNRLESIKCADGSACIAAYNALVAAQVNSTDTDSKKDVKESHADDAFSKFTVPDGPGFFSFWKSSDYDKFDDALTELYMIENSIYLARARRLDRADQKFAEARKQIASGESILAQMCYVLYGSPTQGPGQPTDGDFKNAAARAQIVLNQMKAATGFVKDATDIDQGHKAEAATIQAQIDKDIIRANILANNAKHELQSIGANDCR
jgi:hypothetical protein